MAMLVAATATAGAQAGRPFHDSWFWGVRGGILTYSPANTLNLAQPGASSSAPMVGGDWLITRTTGGLYVSYSQAFLTTTGAVLNGPTSADTGYRSVAISGMRRFDVLGMMFPGDYLKWHPYLGFGVSFRYLGDAAPGGQFTNQKQIDYANSAVNDTKASLGPAFMLGIQRRTPWFSVFGQSMVSVMSKDFLLANGHTANISAEFGIRYNLGSSIDR
jgi:hypothetical protein